ncbi:hypothetical protein [Chromobacterium haemolyticum]|uniref:hypothetical protein n=1 Tax=Chromobacterium haemolyticum TaxID=394935 RepID=UPI001132260A|nr:hypothetical protein [Chromobacterium haemolyticum]
MKSWFAPPLRHRPSELEARETALPYVRYILGRAAPHYWQVPEARELRHGHDIGSEAADELALWLVANPDCVGLGLLGRIVDDIDFENEAQRGQCEGFFNQLEQLLLLGLSELEASIGDEPSRH